MNNTKLKELRNKLGMTQQEFADRLGTGRNNIAKYETNVNEPSNAVISLICREFNVNEHWLRTGIGEMFRAIPKEDETAAIVSDLMEEENPLYDIIKGIMKTYSQLDPKSQDILKNFSAELLHNLQTKKED